MLYVLQSGSVLKTDMLSLAQKIKNPVWSVWSPDGRQIAIEDDRGGNQRTLWVVRADGSQPEQLLDYLGTTHDGLDWTHDGKAISWRDWRVTASSFFRSNVQAGSGSNSHTILET